MKFKIKLEVDDYLSACYLQYLGKIPVMVVIVIASIAVGIPLLILLTSIFLGIHPPLAVVTVTTFFGFLFAYYVFAFPRKLRKIFFQQKMLHEEHTYETTENYLLEHSESTEAKFKWADFVKWKENDQLLMIYISDLMFLLFPKREFESEAEYIEFKKIVQIKVAKK